MKITGSCLCQAVKYQLNDAEFHKSSNCHCVNCRKTHGAAFGTYLPVRKGEFCWLQGEDKVSRYVSSPHTYRCFCSVCGSPLVAFDGKKSALSPWARLMGILDCVLNIICTSVARRPGMRSAILCRSMICAAHIRNHRPPGRMNRTNAVAIIKR